MSNVIPLRAPDEAQAAAPVNPRPEEFILPSNLTEMTPDQVEQLVTNARVIRFQRTEQITKARKSRQAALNAGSLRKFDAMLLRQAKNLEKLDKILQALETGSRDIRAAQIMLGEDV